MSKESSRHIKWVRRSVMENCSAVTYDWAELSPNVPAEPNIMRGVKGIGLSKQLDKQLKEIGLEKIDAKPELAILNFISCSLDELTMALRSVIEETSRRLYFERFSYSRRNGKSPSVIGVIMKQVR